MRSLQGIWFRRFFASSSKVYLVDVTNRDGVQSPVSCVYSKPGIEFAGDAEAKAVLELAQLANLRTQKPLADDKLRFPARPPGSARKHPKVVFEEERNS